MRHYNLHLPDEVRLFAVPPEGVRRRDREAVVYDVAVTDDLVLRHYSFAERWFEVNSTLDRAARPAEEGDAFRWAFNCDVCTPLLQDDDGIYDVDLELDVLVSADGRRYRLKDEAEYLAAVRQGWLDRRERLGALHGLAEVLGLLDRGEFVAFLDDVCPFAPFASHDLQPPAQRLRADQVPMLDPSRRRAQYPPAVLPPPPRR